MRLRLYTTQKTPEETGLLTTTIHAKMKHVMNDDIDEAIVPGVPEKSQMYMRLTSPDIIRMPPKGNKVADPVGSVLLRDWILSLPQ